MKRASLTVVVAAVVALGLPALTRAFGGWAVITIDDLPERLSIHDTTALTFTIRGHGQAPLDNLRPSVVLTSARSATQVAARRVDGAGRYGVRFATPFEGEWTITVKSGFGVSDVVLHPIVAHGRTMPAVMHAVADPVDRGRKLFVAKGCVTCHVHAGADRATGVPVAPELTYRRYDSAWLRRYLANPAIRPPTRTDGLAMPNLGLKDAEIAALVEFLNAEARGTGQEARGTGR